MANKVLVIGSGGREHALSWKLAQSEQVTAVYVSPGNAGTENFGKVCNVELDVKNFDAVASWCKMNQISLVVVGPELPLAEGIADTLQQADVPCFGPTKRAAEIEASKEFAKSFMDRHQIPTARWQSFTDADAACDYINNADFAALVVKASGLAAGKGVIVARDKTEACSAARDMLQNKSFGSAGATVVVEELLEGEEVSCLAFSDGTTVAPLLPAQDHKRAYDGDKGPNTGGMGAYCPCPLVTHQELEVITRDILQRAVDGMKKDGRDYVGILYAGLMMTRDGPKVLEFNCRFGDPETEVVLPLLKSDLFCLMKSCVQGKLCCTKLDFHEKQHAVGVVLASEGYPGSYKKGLEISGVQEVEQDLKQTVFHAGTATKGGRQVTSGGRVMIVVAMDADLATAAKQAQLGAAKVQFEGKFFRNDIAHKATKKKGVSLSYKDSGVDINAGEDLVDSIKPFAAATRRSGCLSELGGFGGVFDVKAAGFKDPLLVSGTDGVGTKLKVAQQCGIHGTVGIDLVAMCVNDVLAHGAEPLYFLDYFACGQLDVEVAKAVVQGVAKGCQMAGCALLGGETAEMPGMYQDGDYDLAGFAVGAVEREQILPRISDITKGDVIISLPSVGVHSNGFSLVRKIVDRCGLDLDCQCPFVENKTLGEELITPTKIYCKSVLPALRSGRVKAFAHITGGGLPGNIPRVLPECLGAQLDASRWNIPPVFGWLALKGNVDPAEMARTFNCGVGAVVVASSEHAQEVLDYLAAAGEPGSIIGSAVKQAEGQERVTIRNLAVALEKAYTETTSDSLADQQISSFSINGVPCRRKRVGVLISGSGTNLQALIDHTQNPANNSPAEITLVISNKPDVQGLIRAKEAGIPTKVIEHKNYKSRVEFDAALHDSLTAADIELVCLAGFMRILTGDFVRKWEGCMLNVHPSLLPSFKGANAHKLVLEANVRISGCTVHFVAEEVDAGAILVQESVPVYPDDTEETLAERVKAKEHKAFPHALDMVAAGQVVLQENNKLKWNL